MNKIPEKLVDVIIPTYNNPQYLRACLESLFSNTMQSGCLRAIIINNGHKNSLDKIAADGRNIIIHNAGENLGWEGGLREGLKLGDSEFVLFLNDDVAFFPATALWLPWMLSAFSNPSVAAVGPSSNVVCGYQNAFIPGGAQPLETDYLIGFCLMVRRRYLAEAGGIDADMPGGDDIDLSIRFRKLGYKLLALRNIFVYHHGFITGTRLKGGADTAGGWNSSAMQHKTNTALIKKHGFLEFWQTMGCARTKPYSVANDFLQEGSVEDSEGVAIRDLALADKTRGQGKVLELGCGARKLLDTSIGVDVVPFGELLPAFHGLGKEAKSAADIVADVGERLPEQCRGADIIIGQHVLEHITDPVKAINHWKETLKDGGLLILAVPNNEISNTIPLNPEHVHAYTPNSLDSLLELLGFKRTYLKTKLNGVSFITAYQKVVCNLQAKIETKINEPETANLQSVS